MEERLKRSAPHTERLSLSNGALLVEVADGVATITLNRPQVLNALSFDMIRGMTECLDAWKHDDRVREIVLRGAGEKAFCAGGDLRELYAHFRSDGLGVLPYFQLEYALDRSIHEYPKRIVAIIDGVVMGGGMGISQGAALRVVGDRTRMAMPETAIGLFPDVGGSYFLSRTPGQLGVYLGLVGATIGAADAIHCGLADEYRGTRGAGEAELGRLRPAIDEHFARPDVESIVASLEREVRAELRDWAVTTRAQLLRGSPTMLKVTLEQLRRGASMPLADCLRMELGMVAAAFEQGDVLEGIRALMIDKDNRPRWNPATLAEVRPEAVAQFFAPRNP